MRDDGVVRAGVTARAHQVEGSQVLKPESVTRRHGRACLFPGAYRINDRYGRCTIGFGLLPPEVRAFKGHATFQRVPESWEF